MSGYNFTERVRKVLAMAREEAARRHNEYVAPEHMMLGLLREGEGVAVAMLERCGVDPATLVPALEDLVEPSSTRSSLGPDLPYTSRAKRALELSMTDAREIGHSYVGTEHLLMGLLRDEQNNVAPLLNEHGVTVERARAAMRDILGDWPEKPSPARAQDFLTGVAISSNLPERLRRVITEAHAVAATLGARVLTPVHLALALLRHRDGAGNAVLDSLAVDRDAVVERLQHIASPENGSEVPPEATMRTSGAWEAVMLRVQEEQHTLGSPAPGTQHLLLALLADREIASAFAEQGVPLETVRETVRRMSG